MGAGFVRFGGVSALLLIAVFIAMIVVGAASPTVMQNTVVAAIFGLVLYALFIVVYLATKVLWNAFGRNGANIPIIFIILMMVAFWVLSLFGSGLQPVFAGSASSVLGYVFLALLALYLIAWIWFTIYCIVAGSSAGGIWKATGILYIVGTLIGVLAAIIGIDAFLGLIRSELASPGSVSRAPPTGTAGAAVGAGIFGFIAGLVLLAGWICHAIGLFIGAGKMEQAR